MTAITSERKFKDLCREAAKEFLQTAIFVDDAIEMSDEDSFGEPKTAIPPKNPLDGIMNENAEGSGEKEFTSEETNQEIPAKIKSDSVDAKTLIDAFLKHEIICSVVKVSEHSSTSNVLLSAGVADVLIVDWYLENGKPGSIKARDFICQVVGEDFRKGGRLRLICVYTTQAKLNEQAEKLLTDLSKVCSGFAVSSEEANVIVGPHTRIVFANKDYARGVAQDAPKYSLLELPGFLLDQFALLTKGLLPITVVAAVAAIRKKTHHLIATFNSNLDGAFAGHRLAIPHGVDAEPFILDLIVDELKTAINDNDVVDRLVDQKTFDRWVAEHFVNTEQFGFKGRDAGGEFLSIVNNNTLDDVVEIYKGKKESGPLSKKKLAEYLKKLPNAFYPNNQEAELHSLAFCEIVRLARTKGQRLKPLTNWTPILTQGTVIRVDSNERSARLREHGMRLEGFKYLYKTKRRELRNLFNAISHLHGHPSSSNKISNGDVLVCIQPTCKCLRLKKEMEFPFLRAIPVSEQDDKSDFDFVFDGNKYKVKANLHDLVMIRFAPATGPGSDVVAVQDYEGWHFNSGNFRFEWMADIRPLFAQRLAAELCASAGSVGPDDFEWLRLRGGTILTWR